MITDIIQKRTNKHADPWSVSAEISSILVAILSIPALTLMVFLRPKLGYRLPKPWLLVTNFAWLLKVALILNVVLYGFHYIKWNTPIGRQFFPGQVTATPLKYQDVNERAPAERWDDPNLPPNYWDMTVAEKTQWTSQNPEAAARLVENFNKRFEEVQAADKQAAEDELLAARSFRPHFSLAVFAVAFLGLGLWRRMEGRKLLGQQWHTMSHGESYIHRLLPRLHPKLARISEYHIQAYGEPILCFFLAVVIGYSFSISLALWLMYAAFCLFLVEVLVMEMSINEALDKYDGEVEGRIYSDVRKRLKSMAEEASVRDGKGVRGAVFDEETLAALKAAASASPEPPEPSLAKGAPA